jgi:hypothetical protein
MRSIVIVDRMSCEINVYTIEKRKRIKGLYFGFECGCG